MTNKETFKSLYREELKEFQERNPHLYWWEAKEFEEVYQRMCHAFDRRTYNKDSAAIKSGCKKLGLKHTYTEINKYLKE